MEQKDIDIYEILKGMPDGTPLYTPLCGNVEFTSVAADKDNAEAIWTENRNGEFSFNKNGRWMKGGEVLLFPSKEMRDWSKFFKKGDVLVLQGVAMLGICIFEKYEDETLVRFRCRHVSNNGNLYSRQTSFETEYWVKIENPDSYIKFVEERLGGKLNLETLEIEKPEKPTFEIGKLYVFNDEDEDGDLTIIGKLIEKNESEDTLRFGNQYEIENEKFMTDQTFDLCISVHDELREATEDEAVTFKEAYNQWENSKKQGKEYPAFKTFDKVLVRIGSGFKWRPALFIRDNGDNCTNRYNVLPLYSGKPADFEHCIPYDGHENIAFTDYDIENLPF